MQDTTNSHRAFLSGVIEGFYGPPWSREERFELFDWLTANKLNSYLYAPKDDLKHRVLWRETYDNDEAESLRELIAACKARGLRFFYALSPGLDIRFSQEAELTRLQSRFEQMLALGCQHFAMLFDDIPPVMHDDDRKRWDSFAAAQCHVTNTMFRWTRARQPDAQFLFCPTPYCGRMASRQLGGAGYLETVGHELAADIKIFWTGPEIISREITVDHAREMQTLLRRKPLIWDNLYANDYDGRRFYCGPFAGRPLAVRDEVDGFLLNPNNEFSLNYIPVRSLGDYLRAADAWDPRTSYLDAMRNWHAKFATVVLNIPLEDLILLGDAFYLPYDDGPEAARLYQAARKLLATPPQDWSDDVAAFREPALRLRHACEKMAALRERRLFYALSRRTWELREELDLILNWIQQKLDNPQAACRSDFHLPGTYRGGFVPRLQRLLAQQPDGTFTAAESSR